jgi:hypothetical protein
MNERHTVRRRALLAVCCAGALVASAQPLSPFDGAWKVTMTCPPHVEAGDDARGYTHRFPGQVVDGRLSATHGTEGEPGWHFLRGDITPDGKATLRLDGIVNNPAHAINDAPKGKPYSYRVKAQFAANAGSGERLTGRVCRFEFNR